MSISTIDERRFTNLNPSFLQATGYEESDLMGKTVYEIGIFVEDEKLKKIRGKLIKRKNINEQELIVKCKDGKLLNTLISIEVISSKGKQFFLTVLVDITERVEYEKKILELSNKDSLTEIYNRRYVYNKGESMIEEFKQTKKEFSVCIVDIDDFKSINDKYGHGAGDCVLRKFTKIVSENLRPDDVFGRYGGEEFIIILKNSDIEASKRIMERILDIIRKKTFRCDDDLIKFTFSAGISDSSEIKSEDTGVDRLIKIADKRMYMAKEVGRNKIIAE